MVSVTRGAERVRTALAALRGRRPLLDRAVLTLERYTAVKGNLMAGGVTYFGVLSFFPVMALAFFAVGYLVRLFPQADDALTTAIEQLFPGMFGSGSEQLSLADLEQLAGTLGVIGVLGALYAGLGWLSAMRTSLLTVFDLAEEEQPNFLLGKARDLATLVAVGVTLLLSVSVSGLVSRYAQELLEWVGLAGSLSSLMTLLSLIVGVASAVLLFYLMFTLLARPHTPARSLWLGALLGAVAFEVLKRLASWLLGFTADAPAFQLFGITLILIVWINYFSRITLYAACWAHVRPGEQATGQ